MLFPLLSRGISESFATSKSVMPILRRSVVSYQQGSAIAAFTIHSIFGRVSVIRFDCRLHLVG